MVDVKLGVVGQDTHAGGGAKFERRNPLDDDVGGMKNDGDGRLGERGAVVMHRRCPI